MLGRRCFLWTPCSRCRTLKNNARDSRWRGWEVVIGIEVHVQLKSRCKLFSHSRTSVPGALPNTQVSPYDAAFPGTFPRLNRLCVDLALRTAIALKSQIQCRSSFDRKHYFYSDLPSGYQITQNYAPLSLGGSLRISGGNSVGIKQIQLEQDTGKSTLDRQFQLSFTDLNRAGTGLMEIVSQPDIRSPEDAGDYVKSLQAILRFVGSSDGNMEQGSLRCDVNVSVNRPGSPPGIRCEIKNLNSVKSLTLAVASEVRRHISILEEGQSVTQDTRGFNEDTAETYKLRNKEDAPEYRFMPDPNLPPLLLQQAYIERIRETMPELPDAIRARLQLRGLSHRDTEILMSIDSGREVGLDGELGKGAVAYFDRVSENRDPKVAMNWITHELLGQLAACKQTFGDNIVTTDQMGELIDLVLAKRITGTVGKMILRYIIQSQTQSLPSTIAEQLSLVATASDVLLLDKLCKQVITAMPTEAQAVRQGRMNVLNKLVGRVMKSSRGMADAKAARTLLEEILVPPK